MPLVSLMTSHFRGHTVTHQNDTLNYLTLSDAKCRKSVVCTLVSVARDVKLFYAPW
jgi:hypothetical protein